MASMLVLENFIGKLGTGLDVYAYGILIRIDEGIEKIFQIYILRSVVMEILRVL